MFEYRSAKALISEQFPETAGSITSFKVESNVMSLNGREPLETDAWIGDDGKLHVVVRRSTSSRSVISSYNKSCSFNSITSITPKASNLTRVELYSLQSSRGPTPRASSFNQNDFYAMFSSKVASARNGYAGSLNNFQANNIDIYSLHSSKGPTPRTSNFEEEMVKYGKHRGGRSMSNEFINGGVGSYPSPYPMLTSSASAGKKKEGPNKELHMFFWSSTASPASEGNLRHSVNRAASIDFAPIDASKIHDNGAPRGLHDAIVNASLVSKAKTNGEVEIEDGLRSPAQKFWAGSKGEMKSGAEQVVKKVLGGSHQMPLTNVVTRLIFIMVWRKLI